MQKAIVVGGSNGIGLALSICLIKHGYEVLILDVNEPDEILKKYNDFYTYYYCDLINFDEELFESLHKVQEINFLMITAGFGKICNFEYLHISEIERILTVNTVSTLKIIRLFYDRIKSHVSFQCGIMGSIAGWISSPMFSVYAASKAGVCRFIESVNAELAAEGYINRILNVSPGSLKGTKFNQGGQNDVSQLLSLAEEIINHMKHAEMLYIPDYETVYKNVLNQYYADSNSFGIQSYHYKNNSGRVYNKSGVRIGYLSGTFDLFHIGHLNILRRAKQQCDYLIVGVHPDASHKGKETFISFEERKAIVSAVRYVDRVVQSCPEDSDAWELWHYTKLFVGSDYKGTDRFVQYEAYFKNKNVEIVYLPYTQETSSTQIREKITNVQQEPNSKIDTNKY